MRHSKCDTRIPGHRDSARPPTIAGRSMAKRTESEFGDGRPSVPGEEVRHETAIPRKSVRHGPVEADRERANERVHGRFHAEGKRLLWRRGRQQGRRDLADEPHLGLALPSTDLARYLDDQA